MNIRKLVSCAAMRVVSIENSDMKLMQSPMLDMHIIIIMKIRGNASQLIVNDCLKQKKSITNSTKPIVKSTSPSKTFDSGMQIRGKYSLSIRIWLKRKQLLQYPVIAEK